LLPKLRQCPGPVQGIGRWPVFERFLAVEEDELERDVGLNIGGKNERTVPSIRRTLHSPSPTLCKNFEHWIADIQLLLATVKTFNPLQKYKCPKACLMKRQKKNSLEKTPASWLQFQKLTRSTVPRVLRWNLRFSTCKLQIVIFSSSTLY
jgi:hypothetical protein